MKKAILAILLLGALVAVAPRPALAQAYIKTDLSKKAQQIKPGMSREEVVEILGLPMWAILQRDSGAFSISNYPQIALELRWDNGPKCLPVTVQFNDGHQVVAVGKGRTCKRSGIDKSMLPTEEYGCWHKDRAEVCR